MGLYQGRSSLIGRIALPARKSDPLPSTHTKERERGDVRRTVLHITNIPTPYRIPQLNEVYRQLRALDWNLQVVFGAAGYERRKWAINLDSCEFSYTILNSSNLLAFFRRSERSLFLYPRLLRFIRRASPDVIMVSGFSVATIKVWVASFFYNTSYIIFSGTVDGSAGARSRLRRGLRRLLAGRAQGAVAYGTDARMYLESLGLTRKSISVAVNTVDIDFFAQKTAELRANRIGPTSPNEFLFVGHLVARKRVDLLLQTLGILARRQRDFSATIVGDGPERTALMNLSAQLNLEDKVRFEGFRQKEELPGYFARAACLLFPTESDIWGLVLNEAMAAGVLCIASIHAHGTTDLIRQNKTGFAVDFGEAERVADLLEWVLDNPKAAQRIGNRAAFFVRRYASLERSASGFVKGVLKATEAVAS